MMPPGLILRPWSTRLLPDGKRRFDLVTHPDRSQGVLTSMMMTAGRNQVALTPTQMDYCQAVWSLLGADRSIELDISEASRYASRTRFSEDQGKVFLGADAIPGEGLDANSRLSTLACLAHELAHAERYELGYRRPLELPDVLLDEAETSLRAAFTSLLRMKDREDLVEEARDRLIQWLAHRQAEGEAGAS